MGLVENDGTPMLKLKHSPPFDLELADNEWHGADGWFARYIVNGEVEVFVDCYDPRTLQRIYREMDALHDRYAALYGGWP